MVPAGKLKMEIQNPAVKSGAKDFFMTLLGVATLYASVVSVLVLLFQYINASFVPPELQSYEYSSILSLIRSASSVLVIVFPVFILISWLIGRDLRAEPEKRNFWVRRWLTYFTLFLTAVTIIIDLIVLVANFYNGELTSRFVLKVLSVFAVSGAVFCYFFWDLRRDTFDSAKTKLFAYLASAAVLILIVSGFFIVGSPATQRALRLDSQRVNDLSQIQYQIERFWSIQNKLPATLDDIVRANPGTILPKDPITHLAYEYRVAMEQSFSPNAYELCATFARPSSSANSRSYYNYIPPYDDGTWQHGAGRSCFLRAPENSVKPINPIPAPL